MTSNNTDTPKTWYERDPDITKGKAVIVIGLIIIFWIWDFITGIPRAIANCFVTNIVKAGMTPMADKQPEIQEPEPPIMADKNSITDVPPTRIIEIIIVVFVLYWIGSYLQINHLWPF